MEKSSTGRVKCESDDDKEEVLLCIKSDQTVTNACVQISSTNANDE